MNIVKLIFFSNMQYYVHDIQEPAEKGTEVNTLM